MKLRIRYNAPGVLTFSLAATFVTLLGQATVHTLFSVDRPLDAGRSVYASLMAH